MSATASRRRAFVAFGLMAAAAGGSLWATPTVRLSDRNARVDLEHWFPRAFGSWRVDESLAVVLPSPDVQAVLSSIYNQVLSRTYVDPNGTRVMLSVAYGGDQSDATRAHRPEVCYPAQGFQILYNEIGEVRLSDGRSIRVRQLMSQLGQRKEPITYWVMVGDQVAVSGTEQKLVQLRYGIKGLIPDGMLVRLSTIDPDKAHGFADQARFLNDLARVIPPELAPRILGAPARNVL